MCIYSLFEWWSKFVFLKKLSNLLAKINILNYIGLSKVANPSKPNPNDMILFIICYKISIHDRILPGGKCTWKSIRFSSANPVQLYKVSFSDLDAKFGPTYTQNGSKMPASNQHEPAFYTQHTLRALICCTGQ